LVTLAASILVTLLMALALLEAERSNGPSVSARLDYRSSPSHRSDSG
jgi:hypothetical protein